MRRSICSALAFCATVTAPEAAAQVGLYLDLGPSGVHGAPDALFGGAAGVGGSWNEIDTDLVAAGPFPFTVTGLVDADGTPSFASVVVDDLGTGLDGFLFDDSNTAGGSDALLDDAAAFGASARIEIRGLAPGQYDVYTYAAALDDPSHVTRVDVLGSADPPVDVGGVFTGAFAPGVTHARHGATVVAGGALTLEVDVVAGFMSLNGIQVVPFGATGELGTVYCSPAMQNWTGLSGEISAFGSPRPAVNDVTLTARSLSPNAFGFFLTSRTQGLVVQPGGSIGTLCLGGAIGRYVGPGQIQNSGPAGTFSLALDLTNTPTPTGLVSVAPGETWNFQAWYRDLLLGLPTSNLTDALSITFI